MTGTDPGLVVQGEDFALAHKQIARWEEQRAHSCAKAGVVMDAAVWRQALVETQAKFNAAKRERDEAIAALHYVQES